MFRFHNSLDSVTLSDNISDRSEEGFFLFASIARFLENATAVGLVGEK